MEIFTKENFKMGDFMVRLFIFANKNNLGKGNFTDVNLAMYKGDF